MENFQEVRPTIIISVPRIYEKVHAGILAKVADGSGVKKAIFNWAMGVASKNLPYVCNNKKRTGLFAKKFNIADKLVFGNLKKAIGLDQMRFAISGGGPLSVSDAEFFIGMGITILEGFGLTETTSREAIDTMCRAMGHPQQGICGEITHDDGCMAGIKHP